MENRKHFSKLGLYLFLGTLIITGVQIVAAAILAELENVIPGIVENLDMVLIVTMVLTYAIAYPIVFLLLKKVPATEVTEKKKMKLGQMVIAFLMSYAGVYICNMIGMVFTTIIGMIRQEPVSNSIVELASSTNIGTNIFIMVICAPIMEELLFRKALIDRTIKYGEGVSVVLSGLLFGLFHGNLNQFVYAFFLGSFFGFIYIKTRNIKYTIILHMITNFMGSVLGMLILEVSGYMEILEVMTAGAGETELMNVMMDNIVGLMVLGLYALCLIGFVITGIVLFIVNRKKFALNAGEVVIEKGQRFKTIFCNLGMGLFCMVWIVMIILQLFGIG